MGNENNGRTISRMVGHRKKLSDITNTPILLKSRIHDGNAQCPNKDGLAHLQEELLSVKNMLSEKEMILAESKRCMEQLWCNYCGKSKQNDEIILHNAELYRELTQARDRLKILQHENSQMSAVYKACKAEMQEKLNDALGQVHMLTKAVEALSCEQASENGFASTLSGHVLSDRDIEKLETLFGKSPLRKKQEKSYTEPPLKANMREADGSNSYQNESVQSGNNPINPDLDESKVKELSTTASVAARCKSRGAMSDQRECHLRAQQQCIEEPPNVAKRKTLAADKVQNVTKAEFWPRSTPGSSSRPQRRAASSSGSYKEPTLKSKMRRAE